MYGGVVSVWWCGQCMVLRWLSGYVVSVCMNVWWLVV